MKIPRPNSWMVQSSMVWTSAMIYATSYMSGLFNCHWSNYYSRAIVKQPLRTWVIIPHKSIKANNMITKQHTAQPCAYNMSNIICCYHTAGYWQNNLWINHWANYTVESIMESHDWPLLITRHLWTHIFLIELFRGSLARYVKLRVAHAPGMPGTLAATDFKGNRYLAIPACITARASHAWRGKRSRHSRCMRKPQFSVSSKGPWLGNIVACLGLTATPWSKLFMNYYYHLSTLQYAMTNCYFTSDHKNEFKLIRGWEGLWGFSWWAPSA